MQVLEGENQERRWRLGHSRVFVTVRCSSAFVAIVFGEAIGERKRQSRRRPKKCAGGGAALSQPPHRARRNYN